MFDRIWNVCWPVHNASKSLEFRLDYVRLVTENNPMVLLILGSHENKLVEMAPHNRHAIDLDRAMRNHMLANHGRHRSRQSMVQHSQGNAVAVRLASDLAFHAKQAYHGLV